DGSAPGAAAPGPRSGAPRSRPAAPRPSSPGSVRAAVGQVLGRGELADDVEVVDQRLAHFVVDRHLPAVADALDLDVRGLHVPGIADVQPEEEQVLDLARIAVGDARLLLQALERLLDRVVL